MSNSNLLSGNGKAAKPLKPRADFPLFPHASKKWAKTILGKTYYFGTWSDPVGAEQEYLRVKDDLFAGRIPSTKSGGITLREICNQFMSAKRKKMESKQLSERTFVGYDTACRTVLGEFGSNRSVLDIGPSDFEKLYTVLTRKNAPTTWGFEIIRIKSIFHYASKNGIIEKPVIFGELFNAPNKNARRKNNSQAEQKNGKKIFIAEDIHKMLNAAPPQLRAMILLGINCGYGNSDCSSLPLSALDLQDGWLDFPRPKTGVERRCPLWPETLAALQVVISNRRKPADEADKDMVFLTRSGQRWVRFELKDKKILGKREISGMLDDEISKGFIKLLNKLELRRARRGFYALRHTFETVAGNSKDQVAVDSIMGHSDNSMAANYRHGLDDSRLQEVVNHVRAWLFGGSE